MSSPDTAPTGAAEQAQPARPTPYRRRPPLSDEERKERFAADMDKTRNEQACRLALAIAKRITPEGILCPKCNELLTKGRFKIHPDGGWKDHKNGCHGDAVSVLQAFGVRTGDAVRVLIGKPTSTPIEIPEDAAALAAAFVGTKSKILRDVFNGVLIYGQKTGGVQAAQDFYGTWHISPEAVTESGAVMITDTRQFAARILERFGEEALLSCGLFTRASNGKLYCLINDRFPVVEPHRHPVSGDVLYMQFRASHAQYQRYLEHKAGNREYKGSEKIISLRGAPKSAQVGTGLPRIEQLPAGSDVWILEGFKDMLAARTGGLEAYGLPGVGIKPPEKICQLLARHNVFVAFDGDEAGARGRDGVKQVAEDGTEVVVTEGLVDYLRRHGVNAQPRELFPGMDATDILVARYASGKATGSPCGCPTCTRMRASHPQWFAGG